MNILKNGFLLFLTMTTIGLSSCNKDDCVAPELSENIIGEWRLRLSAGDVEFRADGTLIDPDDSLIGADVNGVIYDQKSWEVNESTITATAMPIDSSGSVSFDFEVTQNECDEIKFDVFGFTETMTRK